MLTLIMYPLVALSMLHLCSAHIVNVEARDGNDPVDLAALSSEINAEFPTADLGDILQTFNDVLSGLTSFGITPTSFPNFTDYARTAKPTASVFTGPYVSDVVQAYSSFISTRSSGQGFSFAGKSSWAKQGPM